MCCKQATISDNRSVPSAVAGARAVRGDAAAVPLRAVAALPRLRRLHHPRAPALGCRYVGTISTSQIETSLPS